jgi:hypothetical protein
MVASLSLRVMTGTNAGTMSAAQSGVDFVSVDNALNSSANRSAFQVAHGTNSYEKWIAVRVDAAPANYVTNFYCNPTLNLPVGVTLMWGVADTGVTPTAATSTIATSVLNERVYWDTNSYTTIGQLTRFLVLQLQVASTVSPITIPTDLFAIGWQEQ